MSRKRPPSFAVGPLASLLQPTTTTTTRSSSAFDVDPAPVLSATASEPGAFFKGCQVTRKSHPGDTTPLLVQSVVHDQVRVWRVGDDGGPLHEFKEAEPVYDACWTEMGSTLACVSRNTPVHVYATHAYQKERQPPPPPLASFVLRNRLEEPVNAISVGTCPAKGLVLAGLKDSFFAFDVERPGTTPLARVSIKKVPGPGHGYGLVSTFHAQPLNRTPELVAVGTLSGFAMVYDARSRWSRPPITWMRSHHPNGITQLAWAPCGNLLWSGGRRSSALVCYDVRQPAQPLLTLPRRAPSALRVQFSPHPGGRYVATGSGCDACVYDVGGEGGKLVWSLTHPSPVNGVSFGDGELVLACGARPHPTESSSSSNNNNNNNSSDSDFSDRCFAPPALLLLPSTLAAYSIHLPR